MNDPTQRCSHHPLGRVVSAAAFAALLITSQWVTAPLAGAWEMRVCADPDYMPQSNRAEEGYENRIAEILADELGAELTYQWWTLAPSMVSEQLREGNCDMMIGVPDGGDGVLATIAYYRSPYAFVYRADEGYDIATFDDEILTELQLGTTSEGTSAHLALARRGLLDRITVSSEFAGTNAGARFSALIESVARGDIDVAVPWGPVAGYYAGLQDPPLTVTPVPEFDIPFTPMYHSIVIALRLGDEELRDLLDQAIARRWDDIYAVLAEYNVPTLPLPRPSLSIAEQPQ
ncbi:quinoprotein dehydrogenase-associated putative ABC transporter substrate-binding protein [Pelagibacterium sp. H642]|uniref:quinoprotein dehydrogenase-associated putative ABC transporter substrate-binding protein n=1 Tax=Pelagibacterium sp. H642 TaxID=1881069 RepID=UPI002814B212|nr:quinoprotein dehydrogenase-associated putative ABC transporter substrate-binding protein [Pelagibacterium sp. H642]WMT91730.1 quinoprotein dehydrogenase-associated putative ABC transporter substrate-binding protein [Pelagibacterium sp. H642]